MAKINSGGYTKYSLYVNTVEKKQVFAHRLVAMTFLADTFRSGWTINHKDHDRKNNCVENLECVSQRDNNLDQPKSRDWKTSSRNKPVLQYELDGSLVEKFYSVKEAARQTGFNASGISACCRGRCKQQNGFLWKFEDQPDLPGEIWKPGIVGGKQILVSNEGRIVAHSGIKTYGSKAAHEYRVVNIGGKGFLVHRLVAEIFLQKPGADFVVDHIDGNRENNRFQNLRWVSKSQNSVLSKYKIEKAIKAICADGSSVMFKSGREGALSLGIDYRGISGVCCGKRKTYKGFAFEFIGEAA